MDSLKSLTVWKDGSISWNNEDFIHYFEKVEEMREKGTFTKDISNIGYFEAKEQFLGGNAAMFNSEHGISVILREVIWLLKSDFLGTYLFRQPV